MRPLPLRHASLVAPVSLAARNKPFGVLLGGILIDTIFNGLSILNVSRFYQKIALGALIILALALERVVANISRGKAR